MSRVCAIWFAALLFLSPLLAMAGEKSDIGGGEDSLRVTRVAACNGVAAREPVEPSETLVSETGKRLYIWCEVDAKVLPTTITHRYFQGDRLIQEVSLAVRDHRWRTWSYHTMAAGRSEGQWRVEIVDEGGAVLAVVPVTVVAADQAPE